MTTKYLSDFKPGERIRIYVDADGVLSGRPTAMTLDATILFHAEDLAYSSARITVLGWGYDDGMMPNGTTPITADYIGRVRNGSDYKLLDQHPDWDTNYMYAKAALSNVVQALPCLNNNLVSTGVETEGHHCGECNNDYPYAMHNAAMGPFMCSGCKMLTAAWKA